MEWIYFFIAYFFNVFPFIFFVRTVRNILYYLYIWQLKEYRLDRVLSYLKTSQGKRWMLHPFSIFKWIALVIFLYLYYISRSEPVEALLEAVFIFFIIVSYSLEFILILREIISKKLKKPVWTVKTIGTGLLSVVFIALLIFAIIPPNLILIAPLIAEKLLGFFIAILFIVLTIPTTIYRKKIISQAQKKILYSKNLRVIGITGSYGKSSTKEFLSHILSTKYNVLKTPENLNTEIGVAQTILNELKPEHEVFVVEMGAYKKGEIRAICDLVHPTIGILTGINEQHIELFGSIENTMKAKYELIASLPKDGVAIVNGNNKRCVEMGRWAKKDAKKVIEYVAEYKKTGSPIGSGMTSCKGKNILTTKDGLEFDMFLDDKSMHTSAKLFGKHNVENLLAAAVAAHTLGMSPKDIALAIQSITPHDKNMKKITLPSGASAIDDTYNSNPDSVRAILEYMKLYTGKKVLVLMPLIELGERAEEIHKKLGEEIAAVCDHLIITNTNYSEAIKTGIGANKKIQFDIASGASAAELLKKYTDKEDIIGFEGREAGTVLSNVFTKA